MQALTAVPHLVLITCFSRWRERARGDCVRPQTRSVTPRPQTCLCSAGDCTGGALRDLSGAHEPPLGSQDGHRGRLEDAAAARLHLQPRPRDGLRVGRSSLARADYVSSADAAKQWDQRISSWPGPNTWRVALQRACAELHAAAHRLLVQALCGACRHPAASPQDCHHMHGSAELLNSRTAQRSLPPLHAAQSG